MCDPCLSSPPGSLETGRCGNAMVLPVMLVVNGVLWTLPLAMLAAVNCSRQDDDLVSLYGCLEKVFIAAVAFMVASQYLVFFPLFVVSMCICSWLSRTYTRMHARIHVCTHAVTRTYLRMHACTYTHTHAQMLYTDGVAIRVVAIAGTIYVPVSAIQVHTLVHTRGVCS